MLVVFLSTKVLRSTRSIKKLINCIVVLTSLGSESFLIRVLEVLKVKMFFSLLLAIEGLTHQIHQESYYLYRT